MKYAKVISGLCVLGAVVIIYKTVNYGMNSAFSGRSVNVALYVVLLGLAVGLILAAIIIPLRRK